MVTHVPSTITAQSLSFPVLLSDSGATYNVHLNPAKYADTWSFPQVEGFPVTADLDQSFAEQLGKITGRIQLTDCIFPNSQAAIDALKQALVFFANSAVVTLSFKNNSSEELARWPAYSTLTMTAIKVTVDEIRFTEYTGDTVKFSLLCTRYSESI